jgi:hypothetical protein
MMKRERSMGIMWGQRKVNGSKTCDSHSLNVMMHTRRAVLPLLQPVRVRRATRVVR